MAEQSFLAHSGWVTEWIEKWGLKFPFKSGTSWKVKPRNHCVGYGFYIMSILSPRLIFTSDFLKHSPGSFKSFFAIFLTYLKKRGNTFYSWIKVLKYWLYILETNLTSSLSKKELVEWEISLYKIKFNDR